MKHKTTDLGPSAKSRMPNCIVTIAPKYDPKGPNPECQNLTIEKYWNLVGFCIILNKHWVIRLSVVSYLDRN